MSNPRASAKTTATRRTTHLIRDLLLGYRALLEDSLREESLSLPQLRMLKAIAEQAEVSAATIARFCQITPQTLQVMLERAVREGWIVRGTTARNQRILTAALTAKGKKILARGMSKAAEMEAKVWRGVSSRKLQKVNAVLERGAANLHTELNLRDSTNH